MKTDNEAVYGFGNLRDGLTYTSENFKNKIDDSTLKELEQKLKKYLKVKHLFFVSNGTIALQIAIKALDLKREIITTPFSYIATTSSIVWENCTPVFADIDPYHLTINPDEIINKITSRTSAILATHVYGNPCDIEAIKKIADKNNLKIIYDAAHSFGVKYNNASLLAYGDIATLSLHATKLFHTGEGGAIITNDDDLAHRISYMRNFGHHGEEDFWGLGINGKNSELHATLGLAILPYLSQIMNARKTISQNYDKLIEKSNNLIKPALRENTKYNYAYYPVLFKNEKILLKVKQSLNNNGIYPRRYFYPSLNLINYLYSGKTKMRNSEDISNRILCLPLYHSLTKSDQKRIIKIIFESI